MSGFARYISEASAMAGQVDALLLALLLISAFVIGGISLVILIFSLRYHRGSGAQRGPGVRRNRVLESIWIGVPLVVFLAIFTWAAVLYDQEQSPPDASLVVNVIAKQWMWKVQHQGGQREINELHLPLGRPVQLVMTSQDVIHSFFVPAFRIKQDVLPGRYTSLWLTPTREGEYQLFCAEFCGTAHSLMRGNVVVMEPAAFSEWLEGKASSGSLADQGERLFRSLGCSGCHGESATVHAPKLTGIYGRRVPLANGGDVAVDSRYLRDSILLPAKEVAAGYEPIMPSFQGQVGEDDILKLVAYIRSLTTAEELKP